MKKNILIFILFILIIMVMTYPLVFNFNTHIPGFFSTDEPYAVMWDFWRIKYSFKNNLSLRFTNLIAYPFGINIFSSAFISYIWLGLNHLLAILTSPILTWNIQIVLNFLLTALFSYFLVFFLTRSRLAGILGGTVFSFCPPYFLRSWQHLGLTYNEWIPLCLFMASLLKERPLKKTMILFLISIILLFSFDYSITYFGTITLIAFFIYMLFFDWKIKFFKKRDLRRQDFRYLKRVILISLIAFILLSPQLLPIIKNRLKLSSTTQASAFNPYRRPFGDLFSQSAKPLSYLLPATVHPIFGKFTERFVGSFLYGVSFTEHTLYLGWIPLILAFVAFRKWRKRRLLGTVPFLRLRSGQVGDSPLQKQDFYIGFFIFLAVVAWFFSQPPWWKFGPLKIFMPSFFMYKILPMYRAYCRFGIVVMLAVAILAGFGLKFILEKFRSQKTKIAITALLCGLVLFEFWNWPPYKVIDVSKVPAVYYWLRKQPEDIVIAEYPLDVNGSNEMYKFYQTKHEKKIINGTIPGTYANGVAQTIIKLSEPYTAGVLKWMNVKYILVHKEDYLKSELIEEIEELDKISNNPGLKFLKSFSTQECPRKDIMCVQKTGPIDVYEVVAEPIAPLIKNN